MVTREFRLSEFESTGEPLSDQPLQLLCEDHRGTYLLPYACRRSGGVWWNVETGDQIEANVIGWRVHQ